jgi:uncharacterized protein YraI
MVGIFSSLTIVQAQQTPIALGENQVAQVSAGVPQEFVFTATAGQTVTIQALAITPGLVPAFAVFQQDAVMIGSFDNPFEQSNVSGVVTFLQSGAHTITVYTTNGVQGEILVTVTEGGTPPPPPTPLTLDQPTEDILDPGASIVYSFDGHFDPNIALRLLYTSLDPMHGLSVQLGITDGRLLSTFSNELIDAALGIPFGAPVSYVLSLTNDHPAEVTIRYSILLQTVNLAAATPTPVPATLIPLPTTGACVLATQGQFVNMRQGPSTSAPIITTIFPTVIYNVIGRNQDGSWYQITAPEGNGWVSAAVTRLGGDCSTVPVIVPTTATSVPVVTATATTESTSEVTDEPTTEVTEPSEVTDEPTAEVTDEATEATTP